jgi:hypothetical protein
MIILITIYEKPYFVSHSKGFYREYAKRRGVAIFHSMFRLFFTSAAIATLTAERADTTGGKARLLTERYADLEAANPSGYGKLYFPWRRVINQPHKSHGRGGSRTRDQRL